jgi:hypothetical protein
MANVLVQTHVMAMDVDALNRVGVYASANVDNGTALVCGVKSTVAGQEHVFSVTPAAAVAKDLWLAYSPEVVTTVDGSLEFKGLDSDPRHFTNLAGKPFDMFKPVAGVDLIQVTKDFFAENYDPDTITGATYVEIQSNGSFRAVASPTSSFGGLQFKIFAKEPIIIANGAIGGEAVDAWILECTNN